MQQIVDIFTTNSYNFRKKVHRCKNERLQQIIKTRKRKQWNYLKAVGADKYIGNYYNGYKITPSGLLAGAHLKGTGAVITYLTSNGKTVSKDAFGTSIESYMKDFSGYDVSKITKS